MNNTTRMNGKVPSWTHNNQQSQASRAGILRLSFYWHQCSAPTNKYALQLEGNEGLRVFFYRSPPDRTSWCNKRGACIAKGHQTATANHSHIRPLVFLERKMEKMTGEDVKQTKVPSAPGSKQHNCILQTLHLDHGE